MANSNIAEYGKTTRFVAGDPRRIDKPKGAVHSKTILKRLLAADYEFKDPETGEVLKGAALEMMYAALIRKAITKQDAYTAEKVLDRFEGKSIQYVEKKDVSEFSNEKEELIQAILDLDKQREDVVSEANEIVKTANSEHQ